MSDTTSSYFHVPTVEVTERSDGHLMPFLTAMGIFLASVVVCLAVAGLPA